VNREIDTIRAQQGKPPVHLNYFHHDGYSLSNGNTIAMVLDEEVKDQGAGPVDVPGDIIIVLDPNFHVIWVWDAFDHLNVKRKSPLNPTCGPDSRDARPRSITKMRKATSIKLLTTGRT
jgi:hypothetical protein